MQKSEWGADGGWSGGNGMGTWHLFSCVFKPKIGSSFLELGRHLLHEGLLPYFRREACERVGYLSARVPHLEYVLNPNKSLCGMTSQLLHGLPFYLEARGVKEQHLG